MYTKHFVIWQLLESLLQTYVSTWYSNLSANAAFLQQIRLAIGTAVRNLAGRLLQSDISEIIFANLIPIGLQHAKDWKTLVKQAKLQGGMPEDYVIDLLGHRVHPAAYSRQSELNYIRGIVTSLLPRLLPSTYISTNNKVKYSYLMRK